MLRFRAKGRANMIVSRSSVMSLIITFMFEPAKLQMNSASASGARKLRRSAGLTPRRSRGGLLGLRLGD
jgi:hypothetical protein